MFDKEVIKLLLEQAAKYKIGQENTEDIKQQQLLARKIAGIQVLLNHFISPKRDGEFNSLFVSWQRWNNPGNFIEDFIEKMEAMY